MWCLRYEDPRLPACVPALSPLGHASQSSTAARWQNKNTKTYVCMHQPSNMFSLPWPTDAAVNQKKNGQPPPPPPKRRGGALAFHANRALVAGRVGRSPNSPNPRYKVHTTYIPTTQLDRSRPKATPVGRTIARKRNVTHPTTIHARDYIYRGPGQVALPLR